MWKMIRTVLLRRKLMARCTIADAEAPPPGQLAGAPESLRFGNGVTTMEMHRHSGRGAAGVVQALLSSGRRPVGKPSGTLATERIMDAETPVSATPATPPRRSTNRSGPLCLCDILVDEC